MPILSRFVYQAFVIFLSIFDFWPNAMLKIWLYRSGLDLDLKIETFHLIQDV